MSAPWQHAFLAVSVALGESLDVALRALDDADATVAEDLVRDLRSPSRGARAHGMASILAEVAGAIEALRLA